MVSARTPRSSPDRGRPHPRQGVRRRPRPRPRGSPRPRSPPRRLRAGRSSSVSSPRLSASPRRKPPSSGPRGTRAGTGRGPGPGGRRRGGGRRGRGGDRSITVIAPDSNTFRGGTCSTTSSIKWRKITEWLPSQRHRDSSPRLPRARSLPEPGGKRQEVTTRSTRVSPTQEVIKTTTRARRLQRLTSSRRCISAGSARSSQYQTGGRTPWRPGPRRRTGVTRPPETRPLRVTITHTRTRGSPRCRAGARACRPCRSCPAPQAVPGPASAPRVS